MSRNSGHGRDTMRERIYSRDLFFVLMSGTVRGGDAVQVIYKTRTPAPELRSELKR